MAKAMGYQFQHEIIKTYDHHLAYILSCFLGLFVSMKQVAVLKRPKWQGAEGSLWPTASMKLRLPANSTRN